MSPNWKNAKRGTSRASRPPSGRWRSKDAELRRARLNRRRRIPDTPRRFKRDQRGSFSIDEPIGLRHRLNILKKLHANSLILKKFSDIFRVEGFQSPQKFMQQGQCFFSLWSINFFSELSHIGGEVHQVLNQT